MHIGVELAALNAQLDGSSTCAPTQHEVVWSKLARALGVQGTGAHSQLQDVLRWNGVEWRGLLRSKPGPTHRVSRARVELAGGSSQRGIVDPSVADAKAVLQEHIRAGDVSAGIEAWSDPRAVRAEDGGGAQLAPGGTRCRLLPIRQQAANVLDDLAGRRLLRIRPPFAEMSTPQLQPWLAKLHIDPAGRAEAVLREAADDAWELAVWPRARSDKEPDDHPCCNECGVARCDRCDVAVCCAGCRRPTGVLPCTCSARPELQVFLCCGRCDWFGKSAPEHIDSGLLWLGEPAHRHGEDDEARRRRLCRAERR